jgi:tRNA pseudouridine55 synthase
VSDDLHGYLNVLKPPSWTSHDVVARLRRLAGQRRIGHTGTLDPAAVGVLPIAFGRATRTTSSTAWDRKLYWADIAFGSATDTDDFLGKVIATGSTERLKIDDVTVALGRFVGTIEQRPPAYSAVHVDGGRAYAQARRGKIDEPPARPVRVDGIKIIGWQNPALSLLIQCHSGTYIRSLARDLGSALECPAHLHALVRLRAGPFDIRDALRLEHLESLADGASWGRALWPVDIALLEDDVVIGAGERAEDFAYGRSWARQYPTQNEPAQTGEPSQRVRVYDEKGSFLGLAEPSPVGWQPRLAIPVAASSPVRLP